MALTVDEIAEILNTMRVENEHNVENFEKVLTGISAKLELMAGDNEATDLIKVYLTELKKMVEEKQADANARFTTLEDILKNVVLTQDDLAKTSELRDLFHVFSASFDNFLSDLSAQKSLLEKLGGQLDEINNKFFDKDELASLLRGLDEEMIGLNANVEKSFKTIENQLEETSKKVENLGITEQVNSINEKISTLSDDVNLIPSKISFKNLEEKIAYSQNILNSLREFIGESTAQSNAIVTERFEKLENSFETIVTDTDFAGFKKDLADFVQKIIDNSTALNNDLSYSAERIESIFTKIKSLDYKDDFEKVLSAIEQNSGNVVSDITDFREEFKQTVASNLENSARVVEDISDVSAKLSGLEISVAESARENFESVKVLFDDLVEKLSADIEIQKDIFSRSNDIADEKRLEVLNNLSSDIKNVEDVLASNFLNFENLMQNNVKAIKEYIEEMGASVSQARQDSEDKLSAKLANIEVLNHAFETSVLSVNDRIRQVAEAVNMLDTTEIDAELKEIAGNISFDCKNIIEKINIVSAQNDEFSKVVASIFDVLPKKTDVEAVSDAVKAIEIPDYSYDLEQLSSKVDDLSTLFESASGSNYADLAEKLGEIKDSFDETAKNNSENILSEIQALKSQLGLDLDLHSAARKEYFEKISTDLSALAENISVLQEISGQKMQETLDKISADIQIASSKISDDINVATKLNFDDLNISLANLISEISGINSVIAEKAENTSQNVSTAFASVKLSLENVMIAFNSLNDTLKNSSDSNAETILANIDELCGKVDELKTELDSVTTEYSGKVTASINDISEKLDALSDDISTGFRNQFADFKTEFSKMSENIDLLNSEYSNQVSDLKDAQTAGIAEVTTNISEFKSHVDDIVESLRDYIAELNVSAKSTKSLVDSKFSEKLIGIETAIVNSSDAYEEKMDTLQAKLTEFAQNVEKVSSTTEAKITSSLDEIAEIRQEMDTIHELMNAVKLSSDEKSEKVLNLLDEEVKGIITSLEELSNSTSKNINSAISENIDVVENRLEVILEAVEKLNSEEGFSQNLEEKFSTLKQEIELVNTDIANAVSNGQDEMIKAFEPIKNGLSAFAEYDFNKVLSELKVVVETSFMNFSVDVNGELASSSEAVMRLEQVYKELFNKISQIEECVSEKIQNDIELLNVTIESNSKNLQCVLDEKLDDYVNDLKKQFAEFLEDNRTVDAIANVQNELSAKLDTVLDKQEDIAEQADVISAGISTLGDDLKNYVQSACENTIDKYSPIKNKESLDALHQKVDMFVASSGNDDVLSTLDDVNTKTENIENEIKSNGQELKKALDALSNKVDVIVADDSFDALYERFDDFSETEDKVAEMLSALHQKVDVIAMEPSDFDIEEEIDDIKSLIFEQRKYFEASSDEKANAIDKYLKDVLLKLDNVDLEKNSEDIKETIMNALVSLVDQISFVEETEEIKDFVEEKTDAINQSLIEVQNQLRQIASSDDDFSYSYTLQDVESDIAKLRLAITHLSGNDFESLSDDIKKIVNSVEGLESTLTQDQIVDLKSDIEKLNEDILSISSRTNKLLLTSDESYKVLNDGLNNFGSLVEKLEGRIEYLDNSEVTERLEKKIENIQSMAEESANADKVFHQVMMYLGEWIDSTTENISSITDKTSEIDGIKENVADITEKVSDIKQIRENIEELRTALPEKAELLSELEEKFEQQEVRIDRLEMKLEKILSTLEEKDDMVLNRKVDKIEKMLSRLGTNIEKLTSYVDED